MSAITDLLDEKEREPLTDTVPIVYDNKALDALIKAQRAVDRQEAVEKTSESLKSDLPALKKKLVEAQEAVKAKTKMIELQSIPNEDFDEIKRLCPPSAEQWANYKIEAEANPMYARPPLFDLAKLAPLLIAACAVDLESGDAQALWDRLPEAEAARLYQAALALNWEVPYDPKLSENGTVTTSSTVFS